MKHTKGPWTVIRGGNFLEIKTKEASEPVAKVVGVNQIKTFDLRLGKNKELFANAHLIAAAPLMYDVLKLLITFLRNLEHRALAELAAHDAIAKAEGR